MFRIVVIPLSIAVWALSFVTAPADGQSRQELAMRLAAVEARLSEMETRPPQQDTLIAETLVMRIHGLEREQRAMTGELERLGFENRRMQQELESLGVDVDRLLSRGQASTDAHGDDQFSLGGPDFLTEDEIDPDNPYAESLAASVQPLGATVTVPPAGAEIDSIPPATGSTRDALNANVNRQAAAPEPVPDASTLFGNAHDRLLSGDFGGAQELFAEFTRAYPENPRAGEAHYWLGETHFVNGDFQDAADAYIAVLQANRQGVHAPDALVRLGASLAGLGEVSRACQALVGFPAEFPGASEDVRRKAQREAGRIGCE